jgi:hypothetical protein
MTPSVLRPPYPSKQLALHKLVVAARKTVLHEALADALGEVDPDAVQAEMKALAPSDARKLLARAGIRNEHVFATPSVLRVQPSTLGYYRLLLGTSKKSFYENSETGLRPFKPLEEKETIPPKVADRLDELCEALNTAMAALILELDPQVTSQDLAQLPLVTLGAQLDGIYRNDIGKAATAETFLVIRELLEPYLTSESDTTLTLENSSGRLVRIVLASDPDVQIFEQFASHERLNVAIEIKGGSDSSNAHNRAGEAEKSHQKVRNQARDFWTVIALRQVDLKQLKRESPSTREWFNVAEILDREGPHYEKLKDLLAGAVGVTIA